VRDRLRRHVTRLAGEIGERNLWRPSALGEAADWLEAAFREAGDRVRRHEFTAAGQTVCNLEVERAGTVRPQEIVLVGAHYDSVLGSPGANDNASGSGAVVEVARLLAGRPGERSLRFLAFVNEEPPFFQSGAMGSQVYARRARERGERIVAMLSLETIGFYADAPGSQAYPFPLAMLYPSRGDFIAFVGNVASRRLVRRVADSFRRHTDFPAQWGAFPAWLPGVGWSDQWAFWEQGYPGVMVTDTALFRYPQYHTAEDTPERVDCDRAARVTVALAKVVADLARPPPRS